MYYYTILYYTITISDYSFLFRISDADSGRPSSGRHRLASMYMYISLSLYIYIYI